YPRVVPVNSGLSGKLRRFVRLRGNAVRGVRAVAVGACAGALMVLVGSGTSAAPSRNNTTLVIEKGADRTGSQTVSGLAGATFDFFAGTAGSPPGASATPTASCTTTAAGNCSVDVPGRTGNNQGYWIRERTAPAGFSIVSTLDVGRGSATNPVAY